MENENTNSTGNEAVVTMLADVSTTCDKRYESLRDRVEKLEKEIRGESFFDSPEKMAGLMIVAYLASMLLPSLLERLAKAGE